MTFEILSIQEMELIWLFEYRTSSEFGSSGRELGFSYLSPRGRFLGVWEKELTSPIYHGIKFSLTNAYASLVNFQIGYIMTSQPRVLACTMDKKNPTLNYWSHPNFWGSRWVIAIRQLSNVDLRWTIVDYHNCKILTIQASCIVDNVCCD